LMVCSDHGDYAGDYGLVEKWPSGLEDCLTHVPLIARSPGGTPGHVSPELIELFDVMPTCLDLAGTKATHTSFCAQPHATAPRLGGRSTARRLHGRRLQHLRGPGFRADHRGALRPEDTAAERAARNHHPLRLSAHPPLQVHRSPQRSERALRLRAGPEASASRRWGAS